MGHIWTTAPNNWRLYVIFNYSQKIDHGLGHKANLNKFQGLKQRAFSDHSQLN